MAIINQKVAGLQDEIIKLEEYASQLRQSEPQSYQKEKPEIDKNLANFRIEHLECLIEIYKAQNPIKYETKKEALEAKLDYLKQGGNIKMWSYPNWMKLQSVKAVQDAAEKTKEPETEPASETQVKCDQCDFVAKNNTGLKAHSVKHK